MIRKLGIILECDAGGPDELIFKCLVRRLSPDTKVVTRSLGNKLAVEERCADVAEALIDKDHCDLVLIVWDLKPLWQKPGSCVTETNNIKAKLEGLPAAKKSNIKLLCITHELETWLLADQPAIREYLSKPTRPCKWKRSGTPESHTDPKSVLIKLMKQHRGFKYNDLTEAIQIAILWTSTKPLLKVPSFKRFVKILTGNNTADFQQNSDTCKNLCHKSKMMGR